VGDAAGDEMRFETRAIHAGQEPEALYGAVNVPIYQTSTYAQPAVGEPIRWDYGRGGNPTREALEVALAALEGGERGFAFASGLGAEMTLLLTLSPGDHVVLADDVYGGRTGCSPRCSVPGGSRSRRRTSPIRTPSAPPSARKRSSCGSRRRPIPY